MEKWLKIIKSRHKSIIIGVLKVAVHTGRKSAFAPGEMLAWKTVIPAAVRNP
jgi:hypothetical protein